MTDVASAAHRPRRPPVLALRAKGRHMTVAAGAALDDPDPTVPTNRVTHSVRPPEATP